MATIDDATAPTAPPAQAGAGCGRRVLIATNHLQKISGSEVVALEAARHFIAAGCEVAVYASWAGRPMQPLVEAAIGRPLLTDPALVRPFDHDLVYVQHQLLGLFDYAPGPQERAATRIVTGRLSRRAFLESGGWLHDNLLADQVLANSDLTAEHLRAVGSTAPVVSFHNAAPASFFRPFEARPEQPRRVLLVSNHGDPALLEAVEILQRSAAVEHLGRSGGRVELVTPERIAATDLVISIGKTIPYALAGRVPVYVYDHFGGPGYLDAANRDLAARYNFTGRCCERRLSGAAIAAEVLRDYPRGVAFARDVAQDWLERFALARYLDPLLQPSLVDNAEKRRRMAASPFLAQERLLAHHIRASYLREQRQAIELRRLRRAAAAAAVPA